MQSPLILNVSFNSTISSYHVNFNHVSECKVDDNVERLAGLIKALESTIDNSKLALHPGLITSAAYYSLDQADDIDLISWESIRDKQAPFLGKARRLGAMSTLNSTPDIIKSELDNLKKGYASFIDWQINHCDIDEPNRYSKIERSARKLIHKSNCIISSKN